MINYVNFLGLIILVYQNKVSVHIETLFIIFINQSIILQIVAL